MDLSIRAGVEAFAMLGGIQTLPVNPQLVPDPCAVERPAQARFIRPIEGKRLALERWQEAVRPGPVWPWWLSRARCRQRPEDNDRPLTGDRQRNNRPHQLKRVFVAESHVAKDTKRDEHSIVHGERCCRTHGSTEDRLTLPEWIPELGVVAVEEKVGLKCDMLLREDREARTDHRRDEHAKRGCAMEHAAYNSAPSGCDSAHADSGGPGAGALVSDRVCAAGVRASAC